VLVEFTLSASVSVCLEVVLLFTLFGSGVAVVGARFQFTVAGCVINVPGSVHSCFFQLGSWIFKNSLPHLGWFVPLHHGSPSDEGCSL
jgi:hypothetical protein